MYYDCIDLVSSFYIHLPIRYIMKKIAIFIPTRDRPHKINKIHKFWFELTDTSVETDCIVVLDEDNQDKYPRLPNFIYEVVPSIGVRGMTYPLNCAVKKFHKEYQYIGFWGDDHCPKTKNWNSEMYNMLEQNKPYAMAYANDLLQRERLPTEIIMDSKFVNHIGGMVDPKLQHMFVDDYWLCIGKNIKNIHYLNNVVIEHEHHSVNKCENDDMYKSVNTMVARDQQAAISVTSSKEFKKMMTDIREEILLERHSFRS